MTRSSLTRREFNKLLMGGALLGGVHLSGRAGERAGVVHPSVNRRLKAAAIQMTPKLADAAFNLGQAEQLVRQAQKTGAEWIVLPEMFTTAAGFHPNMHSAIHALDGAPARMLRALSREGNTVIGGSFLARRNEGVFNTFVLVFPDGRVLRHDKDVPTYWENCYYKGGADDGVLATDVGNVGSVLCWEFIRSQTAKRLLDRVGLVVGGSCWWTVPDEVEADSPYRAANLQMLKQSAPRMARMLGVPVIHGSHAGAFAGFFSPDLPDVPYNSEYLGEAMIVDGTGRVLASRSLSEGAGVVTATVEIADVPEPSEAIPDRFWIPEAMPEEWKSSWTRWLTSGADYYDRVTAVYLETGDVPEYVPIYMR